MKKLIFVMVIVIFLVGLLWADKLTVGSSSLVNHPEPDRSFAPLDETLPYITSFETASERDDWSVYVLGATAVEWEPTNYEANTGDYSYVHNWNISNLEGWLVSPPLTVPLGINPILNFFQYTLYTFDYRYHGVWVSDGSGNPGDGDFVEIAEIDTFSDYEWNPVPPITITGHSGTIYVAFKYEGADGDVWYIDDVAIMVPLDHDVSCNEIIYDDIFISPGEYLAPEAVFMNPGINTETFDVICLVERFGTVVMADTQTISALAPGASRSVEFASFMANPGDAYEIKAFTDLTTDEFAGNDTQQVSLYAYTNYMQPIFQEFTAVGCYYCPRASEGLHMLYEDLEDSVIIIVYHTTLSFGSDPYYLIDAVPAADYYDVSGYPDVWVNGIIEFSGGYPESYDYGYPQYLGAFRDIQELSSPYMLNLSVNSIEGRDVHFTVNVTMDNDPPALNNQFLRLAVIESEIAYSWNPGDVPQTHLYHTVRDVVTDFEGTELDLVRDESREYEFSFTIESAWDEDEIIIVAFIQDDNNYLIWQAAECDLSMETIGERAALPSDYSLLYNVPNPFNAATRIIYEHPRFQDGKLTIYAIDGQTVRMFDLKNYNGEILWDGLDQSGNDVTGGIYFYRLESAGGTLNRKMVLLK
ncbi:Omp28-related outer membrane protein [bacterium]|nr:Omp28-related outer membrane protein [bacterium]